MFILFCCVIVNFVPFRFLFWPKINEIALYCTLAGVGHKVYLKDTTSQDEQLKQ